MTNIPVIGFAGYSGTGKTTLLEKLVKELKGQGLRIAVLKHDGHDFEIDHAGKDSWRYAQAGADVVMISSAQKAAAVVKGHFSLAQLLEEIRDVDLILIEGYKNEDIPQIGMARQKTGKGFTADMDRFIALVTDLTVRTTLPCFDLNDVKGIAAFIMKRIQKSSGNAPEPERPQAKEFTHFNEEGRARMVNVGEKPVSQRTAVAAGRVLVNKETLSLIRSGGIKKGDVLTVAQVAGVMGAKRTPELIPMCHPIWIEGVDLSLHLDEERCSVEIKASVSCDGKTGVEMEALTAVSAAALTVYDMCKAVQKDMVITDIRLIRKTGGVHGDFQREESL